MHRIKKSRERRLGRGQRDREILLKEKDRTRMTLTDRCARLRVRVPRRTTLNRTYVTATPLSVPSCPSLTLRTGKMGGSAWEGARGGSGCAQPKHPVLAGQRPSDREQALGEQIREDRPA
ncbi:hypothetical protein CALVIDRAFT_405593 [Calocera viscosa TUFC12733]|uniref:Uncharacterized protein n=1 Tax=Calocera viscosa (strain TUFC12733) TaxID=1330018 RepID=A0A167PXJ5_CALVF|nr:hypothetical protein CALVIDRAFT_405593 [Calocera viscosa TUFC12733]